MHQDIAQKLNEVIDIKLLFDLSQQGNINRLRELLSKNRTLYDLKDKDEFNILHDACQRGLTNIIQLCIELEFNLNIKCYKNRNAVHIVCRYGNSEAHIEIIKLLLVKNKNIIKEIDSESHTPLYLAYINNHGILVEFLINCLGELPLHAAVSDSLNDIIPILLTRSPNLIDIPSPNDNNNTVLHKAILKLDIQMVSILANHGASLTLKNGAGRDAIDIAIQKGQNFLKVILQGKICKQFVEINNEDTIEIIKNKLITSLLYIAKRHSWESEKCLMIRRILTAHGCALGTSEKEYETQLRTIETLNRTFYGSYLSDDSDSDEEATFNQKTPQIKSQMNDTATNICFRAECHKIPSHIGKQEDFVASNVFKGLKENRQALPHDRVAPSFKQASTDLEQINNAISQTGSIKTVNDGLQTQFFVAQYRGVTYLTTKWNQTSRRRHRKQQEIGKAQYSASVLFEVTGKTNFLEIFDDEFHIKNEKNLEKVALVLKEMVANLKNTPKCRYENYTYDNLYELLQCIYTASYDKFKILLKNNPLLRNYLLNDQIPFISTGNVPYHALKYAYGIKPYEGHKDERLRPRWQSNGKAERPFSGKVYVSLHPITDFENHPHMDVIDLNWSGKIDVPGANIILAERETSFAAYICEGRIVIQHVAKYPSFHEKKPYKNIYLSKYGLTQELYTRFKDEFFRCLPHQDRMKYFKQVLGEWLCAYNEVRLIRLVKSLAEEKGALLKKSGFLVYRDLNGKFSFGLPTDTPTRNGVSAQVKEYPKQAKNFRKEVKANLQQIHFITNQCIISPIDIMQPLQIYGIQYCSLLQFHQAVISGNVNNVERLFYPLEYLHMQFPVQNEILATTVLHYTVTIGLIEVVKFLIAKGAPINARDANGDTPLHIAIRREHHLIARILIFKGASVKIINKNFESPYDIALNKKMQDLVNLMLHTDERHVQLIPITNISQLSGTPDQNNLLKIDLENTQKQLSEKLEEMQKLKLRVAELETKLEMQQQSHTQYASNVQSLAIKLLTLGKSNGEINSNEIKTDKKNIFSLSLNDLYKSLTEAEKLAQISSLNQDIKATDFGIEQALNFYFSKEAHILQPSLSSISSPFDVDILKVNEALKNYGERISGYSDQDGIRQKNSFIDEDGGVLKKPIIMIINTTSATAKFKQDVNATGGNHWVTCVILPKKYSINGKEFEHIKERIFYIDSYYENNKLPQNFKDMLTKGFEYKGIRQPSEKEDPLVKNIPYKHTISPAFADPEFIDLESIPQQIGGEDCGWWSFYNALMIVMTGESLYVQQFKERSREFAYKLRAMLPSLSNEEPLVKIKQNINIPSVQQLIDNSIFSPTKELPLIIPPCRVESSKIEQRN